MILRKFLALPGPDKALYIEALLALGLSRLAIVVFPFKWIAGQLGESGVESSFGAVDPAERRMLERVGRAVNGVSGHTIWESKCLAQAMSAKLMLQRRRIKSTLYLGAGFDEEGQMTAHAWLRCGDVFVTGDEGRENYGVTGIFGDR